MSGVEIKADLEWYIATSTERQVLPRCPFATVDKCPRYYQSVLVLGLGSQFTQLDPDENQRLLDKWKKTDVLPAVEEDVLSTSGGHGGINTYWQFCPEVSFERFGWFASSLIGHHHESEREVAHAGLRAELTAEARRILHEELSAGKNLEIEVDISNVDPGSDWRWAWSFLTPRHYTECPLYAPLSVGVSEIVGDRKRPIGFINPTLPRASGDGR